MSNVKKNEKGFIPLLIVMVLIIAIVVIIAYVRVSHAHH